MKASVWAAAWDKSENDIRPGVSVLWEQLCSYLTSNTIAQLDIK